jgi:predicted proteasome-type protease
MTYCLGLVLDQGLVMASDSRTNAGIDYVTTFSKLHVFTPAADRIFVLLGRQPGHHAGGDEPHPARSRPPAGGDDPA